MFRIILNTRYNRFMIHHQVIDLGNPTAVELFIPEPVKTSYTISIQNVNDVGYVYIGNRNVTQTEYGFKIYPGQAFAIELPASQAAGIWGVGSQPGLKVAILEIDRAI